MVDPVKYFIDDLVKSSLTCVNLLIVRSRLASIIVFGAVDVICLVVQLTFGW